MFHFIYVVEVCFQLLFWKHTYKDVAGWGVTFFNGCWFTWQAAAAAAGPGRTWVIGIDRNTARHFTSGGYDRFGGDFGFAIGG